MVKGDMAAGMTAEGKANIVPAASLAVFSDIDPKL